MTIALSFPADNGTFETGSLVRADGKTFGNNQVVFEFYSDAECKIPVIISAGVITLKAKQSVNSSFQSVPDGTNMNMAESDAPLRFSGVANYLEISKSGITGAAYVKIIIDKY